MQGNKTGLSHSLACSESAPHSRARAGLASANCLRSVSLLIFPVAVCGISAGQSEEVAKRQVKLCSAVPHSCSQPT